MIQRRVVCAANRCSKDPLLLVCSARHFDPNMRKQIARLEGYDHHDFHEQGFIDQFGVFMDRVEALAVATAADQIDTVRPKTNPLTELFSEDLY
jgi:hypothetical protein